MSGSELVFGVGAATFGITILALLKAGGLKRSFTTQYHGLPLLVVLVATGSYGALLAHEFGYFTEELVWSIRYADWALTAPILAYYVGLLAGASRSVRTGLSVVALGMVGAGYAALQVTGTNQWVAYALSGFLYLVLASMLLGSVSRDAADSIGDSESRSVFESLRDLTVFVWLLFPVAWILGPGLDFLLHSDRIFLFLVLDLSAKAGFASVIVFRQYALRSIQRTLVGGATGGTN
jgi:sensory rhodopsin